MQKRIHLEVDLSMKLPRKALEDEVVFLAADKYKSFLQADNITLGVHSQGCPKYPKQQVYNISRKTRRMNLIFCLQVKFKGFFKLIPSFYMCVARHGQITQSNKFAIYLQYLEKKVSDEVDSLRADKHESLLQIDTMTQLSLRRMQSHAIYTCAIYCMRKIIVFALFVLILLYISRKKKFSIERFFIEDYIQKI